MTLLHDREVKIETIVRSTAPPNFLEDDDAYQYLCSLILSSLDENAIDDIQTACEGFFGESHEREVEALVDEVKGLHRSTTEEEERDKVDEKFKDLKLDVSRNMKLEDVLEEEEGEKNPQAIAEEVKHAKKPKKNRPSRQERKAMKKGVRDKKTKKESAADDNDTAAQIKDRSAQELEELDDYSSAWTSCQKEGRGWGGRGHGGRGVKHSSSTSNVHLSNVTMRFAGNELLQNATIQISQGRRYGLIGRNGVGKSTLLRRFANKSIPGFPLHMRVFLVQQEVDRSDKTTLQALLDADEERAALLSEQERIEQLIDQAATHGSAAELTKLSNELSDIMAELDAIGADEAEDKAKGILKGLQFSKELQERTTSQLSGGWRMRLALAQALFVPSDLVLLDEPTNHLDLHAVLWLTEYLTNSSLTLIVVSHDRAFLDMCTDIINFEHKKLKYHVGNYSAFVQQQEDRTARQTQILDAAERQRSKAMAFIEKQQSMANKKNQDPNKLRQAKMIKEKKLDRIGNYREDGKRYKNMSLKKLDEDYLRTSEKVVIETDEPVLKFKFPDPPSVESRLIKMENCSFGYSPEIPPLLNNMTLDLNSGSKVAVVGRNGAGKSTLLKIITAQLKPNGEIWRHPILRIGHVTQHHVEALDPYADQTVVQYMEHRLQNSMLKDISSTTTGIRSHLGAFGLGGKHAKRNIGSLSGGEKMRLCFATVMADNPHLLVLDEPTNHLDMETLDALASALDAFKGAVVIVSHNQGFLCGFCNELWIVERGSVVVKHSDSASFEENFSMYRAGAIQGRSSARQVKASMAKRAEVQRAGVKQSGGFIG